jgi:hypothetical protein
MEMCRHAYVDSSEIGLGMNRNPSAQQSENGEQLFLDYQVI